MDRYGRIMGWDQEKAAHAEKLVVREARRLEISFAAAKKAGYHKFIMFLHYPPTNILQQDSIFTQLAEENGVEQVVYSHCHGEARYQDSFLGEVDGIEYKLVSSDYLRFQPEKILR